MSPDTITVAEVTAHVPSLADTEAEFARVKSTIAGAATPGARREAFAQWDDLRRRLHTWQALTRLRYSQNTQDAQARAALDAMDELNPQLTELDDTVKRELFKPAVRAGYEPLVGAHAFAVWEQEMAAFAPAIAGDLVREAQLCAEYTSLIASAQLPFDGGMHTLTSIGRYKEDRDREVRHAAQRARWDFFAEHGAQLDRIFDDLVKLRHAMAQKLGLRTFVDLGYRRMMRIDYDQTAVNVWRDEVAAQVVPLASAIYARRAARLGLERVMAWDESAFAGEPPKPMGDGDWVLAQAAESFGAMSPSLRELFAVMRGQGLIDASDRPGKAGGAFCTTFPTARVPFVFCNFNGTGDDVKQLAHEMGHAFQCWRSRDLPVYDYLTPTMESAEIDSMSLEFFTWPAMDHFFGERADAYRAEHLEESLIFLPYGVAVDHFQHLVYESPDATPAERKAMWRGLEQRYLPWRDYGDLAYPAAGGFWQVQRHIYRSPFYYIDYTLAMCCALQFWIGAMHDRDDAWRRYEALCARGGSAPFCALIAEAGLKSPFEPGVLRAIVLEARKRLEL